MDPDKQKPTDDKPADSATTPEPANDSHSLEGSTETESSDKPVSPIVAAGQPSNNTQPKNAQQANKSPANKDKKSLLDLPRKIFNYMKKVDIFLLIFVLIVILALIGIIVAYQSSRGNKNNGQPQELNQSALSQLNSGDTSVGNNQQTLNIESNSVFSGSVLIKNNLQVAGSVQLAGALNIPSINVSGSSDLNQIVGSSLVLSGDATIKGTLALQNLTVNGSTSLNGSITVSTLTVTTLQVNGAITFANHLKTSGSIPRSSSLGGIGGGGTSSVNGTDTSGTVNINTGSGPGGCLTNITFASAFGSTPNVVISPNSSAAAQSQYYVTKSSTGFQICANSPPGGSSLSFSYFVIN